MPGKGRSDPDEDRSRPPALKDGQLKLVDWTLATLPVWWDEHVPRLSGSLTMLNLKSNLFKATPDLRSLQRLVELNLNGNELTALDATGLPPSLLRLHAVNNKIVHVERGLLNALPRLNRLDLTGNHLTKDGLASAMAGLSTNCSLEALDISCNHLQARSLRATSANLIISPLGSAALAPSQQLPPGVLEASSLLELRVNMNPLSACPPLSALCSLVFLGLARCGLSTLASEVRGCCWVPLGAARCRCWVLLGAAGCRWVPRSVLRVPSPRTGGHGSAAAHDARRGTQSAHQAAGPFSQE